MSDEAQVAAHKARITAYTKAPTLDLAEIKAMAQLPAYYVELHLARRFVDNESRVGGTYQPTGYRLSTRACATSLPNARLLEENVRLAYELNPILLDGQMIDVRYESGGGDFEQDDEGYYAALTDRIYVR